MLTSLTALLNPISKLGTISKHCFEIVAKCTISEKIQTIALSCFKGGTSLYLSAFGTSELVQNVSKKPSLDRIEDVKIKNILSAKAYLNLHGSLMLGSGIFSLIDALNSFGVIALNNAANIISTAGSVLFLCANIFALEENLRLFNLLKETDWTKTNIDEKELAWTKQSAFWGAVSNFGYIIATASLLFCGATAVTLLMAVLSCLAGGVKILYDLALWGKSHGYFA